MIRSSFSCARKLTGEKAYIFILHAFIKRCCEYMIRFVCFCLQLSRKCGSA